jgi:hypothetical protein
MRAPRIAATPMRSDDTLKGRAPASVTTALAFGHATDPLDEQVGLAGEGQSVGGHLNESRECLGGRIRGVLGVVAGLRDQAQPAAGARVGWALTRLGAGPVVGSTPPLSGRGGT